MLNIWQTHIHKSISKLFLLLMADKILFQSYIKKKFINILPVLSKIKNKNYWLSTACRIIHTFFCGITPDIKISDLVRDVKSISTGFINEKRFINGKFLWQHGFGAFSYSHSHIDRVVKYVLNQEEHHRKKTFREEYIGLLEKFNVEYNPKYIFEFYNE
ncbi:MAG: transposase [Chlorobi bacterium OLB5]|nr:MAG: transposase [Chlorobi bacterium OLB5]